MMNIASGNLTSTAKSSSGSETNRRKLSISLSRSSAEAFEWLRGVTDADTDSEVVRNALRVHYVLLQKQTEGKEFFVRGGKGDDLTKVDLFVDTTTTKG